MPVKIIGFLIAMIASILFGFYFTGRMKQRISELMNVLTALNLIQTEITFKLTQKNEILKKISEEINASISNIFCERPIYEDLVLGESDRRILNEFNQSFGHLDYHSQMNRVEWCIKNIEANLLQAKEDYTKYARLAKGFSPLIVGALCLLLF